MIQGSKPFLVFNQVGFTTIPEVIHALQNAGLEVIQSFDLQSVRGFHSSCECPRHGTDHCPCQYIVLCVYGPRRSMITLVIDGRDKQTWVSFAEKPGEESNLLADLVVETLTPAAWILVKQEAPVGVG